MSTHPSSTAILQPTGIEPMRSESNFISRLLNTLSTTYLIAMVVYFALRLILGDRLWWIALLNAFVIYTFIPAYILLVLAALAGLWRQVARLGLLTLLSILWFGPFFQQSLVPVDATNPTLKVVTFNMGRSDEGVDWLRSLDADVVILQEVEEPLPTDLYPYQIEQPGNRVLLSRYPVISQDDDAPHPRAVVDVDGQEIAVYNVSMPVPIADSERFGISADVPIIGKLVNYDEEQRNEEIMLLYEFLESEPLPHIVAGDFNMSQHALIYSDLTLDMTDVFRATSAGLGVTWSAESIPLLRLDYIWISDTLRAIDSDIGPALGGDHLPVLATMDLD